MVLVTVIPAAFSLFIFERINSFNQDLQHEAVLSIDAASEVYRSLIKSESDQMALVRDNLYLRVDAFVEKHQNTRRCCFGSIARQRRCRRCLWWIFGGVLKKTARKSSFLLICNRYRFYAWRMPSRRWRCATITD